jgi:protein SCO1/2
MGRISSMRVVVAAALLLAVFLFVSVARPASGPRWGANYFPNVPLTTQDGATVHFYDDLIRGKIVVIDLIYTECKDMCPLETARLAQVQRLLGDRVGKDIFFYSITIDPKQDTPKVLKAYAEKFHAGPGWLFLTGKEEDILLISKKLGLYADPDPANRDGHTPGVLLGNEPAGQWMRNSATDNPRFLAVMIGDFLNSWRSPKTEAVKSYAEVPQLSISDQGKYLFSTHCAACHTIGKGDAVGPDLMGVTGVRNRAWLERYIKTPDEMLAANDPIALALFEKYKQVRMPNLRLSDVEANALLNYLQAQNAGAGGQH